MTEENSHHEHEKERSRPDESCPLCCFMRAMRDSGRKHSAFYTHIFNAQIEVLQAFKSLVDQRISTLEKRRNTSQEGRKATKIEVE